MPFIHADGWLLQLSFVHRPPQDVVRSGDQVGQFVDDGCSAVILGAPVDNRSEQGSSARWQGRGSGQKDSEASATQKEA